MTNFSPPKTGARNEPWAWPESQQLEVNPNHWAADSVVLAIPVNRPFIEDVSPYQGLVTYGIKGTAVDLADATRPFPDGRTSTLRGLGTGDSIYVTAPHTDHLGAAGTEFTLTARHRTTAAARNWRNVFVKGGGGGSVVWYGVYSSTATSIRFQYDNGSAANDLGITSGRNVTSTEEWSFSAQGFNHNILRAALHNDSYVSSASANFNINNSHNWVIGGGQFRNDGLAGDVKDMLVLDRLSSQAQMEDLDRNMADVYRPKIRRSFFFYEAAAVAAAARQSQLTLLGVS